MLASCVFVFACFPSWIDYETAGTPFIANLLLLVAVAALAITAGPTPTPPN